MPASAYTLVFKEPDCTKLAHSNKLEIGTYTTDKIKVIGSCTLFVEHPDTQCLKEVTFYVTSHEGSAVLSCATTLELSLIQCHNNLDHISSSASLISSKIDHLRKNRSWKYMQVQMPCHKVHSSKEQSPALLTSHNHNVNQCVVYEDQNETSKQECTAYDISICDDNNCQSTKCVKMQQ